MPIATRARLFACCEAPLAAAAAAAAAATARTAEGLRTADRQPSTANRRPPTVDCHARTPPPPNVRKQPTRSDLQSPRQVVVHILAMVPVAPLKKKKKESAAAVKKESAAFTPSAPLNLKKGDTAGHWVSL